MSYRNPKVYAPDPTAFAKSFMGSFQSTMQGFEAEKEKKRQQQEKDDLIEAEYLRYTNIGDLEGVSESINSALQDSINNMVDSKTFVNMSAVERQKVLNDIGNIKAGSQSLVELLSIDPSEISNRSKRSNPELHAILSQMRLDPSKIKISGDLTNPDVKFSYTDENGNINTTSLRDLRRYKNTYVSRIDDENNFNKGFDNFIEGTQKLIKEDAAKGKATKTSILDNFLIKGYDENNNRIYNEQALSNDDKAHIWYEMMEDKDKENLKTFDLYPKGQKPEDRKMQDQAIYDYYYNMANQKLIQPAVRDITLTGSKDTRTAQQKNADDLKEQADQVKEFMQGITLENKLPSGIINPKMPKRPIKEILSDFTKALNPKGYRIVQREDGGYDLEQLERVTTQGIKVNKDLTDITSDVKALMNNNSSDLISTILTKVYRQLPIYNN